jgi:uncharacterized integral membrane protein
MANFLICLILGGWVMAIAVFSVQNATAISVRFLFFQSFAVPVGVTLAFCFSLGLLGAAFVQIVWQLTRFLGPDKEDVF